MRIRSSILVRLLVAATMFASIAGLSVIGSAPAHARPATQSTTCSLKSTVKFNPGLTFSKQQQKIKAAGSLSNCVGGGVSSATFTGKGGGKLSCTSGTGTATLTVTWNTNETSTVSLSIDVGARTISGMVTSGKFAGEPVSATNVSLKPVIGNCFTPVTKAKVKASVSL